MAAFGQVDRLLRRVAEQTGAVFIDAHGPLGGRTALFDDHVHLSRPGSARLAEVVAEALRPVVAERSSAGAR